MPRLVHYRVDDHGDVVDQVATAVLQPFVCVSAASAKQEEEDEEKEDDGKNATSWWMVCAIEMRDVALNTGYTFGGSAATKKHMLDPLAPDRFARLPPPRALRQEADAAACLAQQRREQQPQDEDDEDDGGDEDDGNRRSLPPLSKIPYACVGFVFGTARGTGDAVCCKMPFRLTIDILLDNAGDRDAALRVVQKAVAWSPDARALKALPALQKHEFAGWHARPGPALRRATTAVLRISVPSLRLFGQLSRKLLPQENDDRQPLLLHGKPLRAALPTDPTLQFLEVHRLQFGDWVAPLERHVPVPPHCATMTRRARVLRTVVNEGRFTTVAIEQACLRLRKVADAHQQAWPPAAQRVLAWDVEVLSLHGFPNAERAADQVLGIGFTLGRTDVEAAKDTNAQHALLADIYVANGPPGPAQKEEEENKKNEKEDDERERRVLHYVECPDEAAALTVAAQLLQALDPDLVVGFNTHGFDYPYVSARARLLGGAPAEAWSRTGRFWSDVAPTRENARQRTAVIPMSGRVDLDLIEDVRKRHKMQTYSLNAVARKFLPGRQSKQDWTPADMNRAFQDRRNAPTAAYCVQDCRLLLALMSVWVTTVTLLEASRLQSTQIADIVGRGTQFKTMNQMTRAAHDAGFVMTRFSESVMRTWPDTYVGAIVLDALKGLHADVLVLILDYMSLYPSIMIQYNLGPDTYVCTYKTAEGSPPHCAAPETYLHVVHPSQGVTDVFVRDLGPDTGARSVLKDMLLTILATRRAIKKRMKQVPKDSIQYMVLDARQKALKVSANAIYGFQGVPPKIALLAAQCVARCVTQLGQQQILKTKTLVEAEREPTPPEGEALLPAVHHQVIYGDTDSVFVAFRALNAGPAACRTPGAKQRLLARAFREATRVAARVTRTFLKPGQPPDAPLNPDTCHQILEAEAVYGPLLLESKKRYGCLKFTKPDYSQGCVDVSGLGTERRDVLDFTRRLMRQTINALVGADDQGRPLPDDGGATSVASPRERVTALVTTALQRLLEGRVPLRDLAIGCSMKAQDEYAKDTIPQVTVHRDCERRAPGSAPKPGERFLYVLRAGAGKPYERAVLLANAQEEGKAFVPDYMYYLTNRIRKPLEPLFTLLFPERPGRLFEAALRVLKRRKHNLGCIADHFSAAAAPAAAAAVHNKTTPTHATAQPQRKAGAEPARKKRKKKHTPAGGSLLAFFSK